MIHVRPQPEPPDFDAKVRQPGLKALQEGRQPLPDHWRNCLADLHQAYGGICAYLCVYIPPGTGARTVEHFAPKSRHRDLAYEWSNYRLVCSVINARKRDFEDVLDPFEIEDGLFQLNMTTMKIFATPGLAADVDEAVQATITRLKLNDRDCLDARTIDYDEYIRKQVTFAFLKKRSPFVAMEVERQGLRWPGDENVEGPH